MKRMKSIEVAKDYLGRGVIGKLSGSHNYYMRFRIHSQKGWTNWKATGTPNFNDAAKIASKEYERVKELVLNADRKSVELSQLRNEMSFVSVAYKWLDYYRIRAEAGIAAGNGRKASTKQYIDYKKFVDGYITEYFGSVLDDILIDKIKTHHILEYITWRRVYWTEGPGKDIDEVEVTRGKSTYMKPVVHKEVELASGELVVLRSVFNYAVNEGLIKGGNKLPEIPKSHKSVKEVKKTRYPAFSKAHWKIVIDHIDEYIALAPSDRVRQARIGLKFYLIIMAETGIRAGKEHQLLKWKHIDFDTDDQSGKNITIISIPEDTKTGGREIIVGEYGTALFKQLKDWSNFKRDDDFVFHNPANGEVIARYDTRMKNFLKFADIELSIDDKPYQPYSLRHTFATRMRERGLPDHIIARMMGHTDTKMLQRHYGQDDLRSHVGAIHAADKKREVKKRNAAVIDAVTSLPMPEHEGLNLLDPNGEGALKLEGDRIVLK